MAFVSFRLIIEKTKKIVENEIFLEYDFCMNENAWKGKWSKSQIKAMMLEQGQAFWQRDTGIVRVQQPLEREIHALVDGMRSIPQAKGLILTDSNIPPITVDEFTVENRSVAEWLLEESQE